MDRTITMLGSLQTTELSLVRRGANNRRFAVTKGMQEMDINEVLRGVLETAAEGEDSLRATLKSSGLDGDAVDVAVAQYRLQHGFADKIDAEAFATVAKAAGYVAEAKAQTPEQQKVDATVNHEPVDMPPEMKAVWKSQQDEIAKLRDENNQNRTELEAVKKAAKRSEYITKCANEYSHVPGLSSEQMADMLIEAEGVSKAFADSLQASWLEASEAVKKSALIGVQGRRGTDVNDGSAWSKMEAMAKDRVAKSAGKVDIGQALQGVMDENPGLYEQYLNENPAQRSKY